MQQSYEDQLYVWRLLLRDKLAGKIAPAHPKDNRALEYALLIPEQMAVDEINAITDVEPITRKMLTAIVREFASKAPPYPSFAIDGRVVYMREPMRKRRAVSKNGTTGTQVPNVPKLLTKRVDSKGKKESHVADRGSPSASPASAYGYVLVNGIPRWNKGALHLESVRKAA